MLDILHEPTIDNTWYRQGICHTDGIDPELFYPIGTPGYPAYDKQVDEAKSHCNVCPVRDACLLWAVESLQEFGVWGGTEENERVAMMRTARQAGALAINRYPTNGEVADIINKLLETEREHQKRLAEHDREAQKRRRQ